MASAQGAKLEKRGLFEFLIRQRAHVPIVEDRSGDEVS